MSGRVYLSGPMRGIPEFNFPRFHSAAKSLRAAGYDVVNPAESFNGDTDLPWSEYMRKDISDLLTVDEVFVLPGWENSPGCRVELAVAYALGLPVIPYRQNGTGIWTYAAPLDVSWIIHPDTAEPEKTDDQQTVLQEANSLIYGDRQKAYGPPSEDFKRTAAFWTTLFGVEVTPEQVPMAMWLMKTSRLMNRMKRDSIVDIAGYAGTLQMVLDER